MSFLEVKDLRKKFGATEVLKGVSFSLERGEVVSLIGFSGGGKTTLLRCLNFLELPNSGEISIDGEAVFSATEGQKPTINAAYQKRVGLIFQQFNLFPQYTVLENLMLSPRLKAKKQPDYRRNKSEILGAIEARAREMLDATGLADKADTYPSYLSGGQQQRVAIARALMLDPDILCFDEPTSALDPRLTGEIVKLIRELRSRDRAMIIVTHEIEFARQVSDTVIYMQDGVIEEIGTPKQVLDHPKSEKTRDFLQTEG